MKLTKNELKTLQNIVREGLDIDLNFICRSRKRECVMPRQIYQYLLVTVYNYTCEAAGKVSGKFDHATVLYSMKTVNNRCETEKDYAIKFKNIKLEAIENYNSIPY